MKWYVKLLITLLVIIFSPLIAVFIIIAAATYLFQLPKIVKEYKKSKYYQEFRLPYATWKLYSPEYRFYNSFKIRNLKLTYVRQESNGFEYFIHNETLFLFPDFDQIDYDEEKSEWQVDYDGDWKSFKQAYKDIVFKVDPDRATLPVRLLIERKMFPATDLNGVAIPECIFLTWNYETAFENEDSPLKLRVPTNTQELYNMMVETPKLCGKFKIAEDGNICWSLYDDIQISISVDPQDCCFSINKRVFGKIESRITHWHPTIYEIYNDVCEIGMPGNVMVIRTFMSGANVLYMGDEQNCSYSSDKNTLFGKYYYLKAN